MTIFIRKKTLLSTVVGLMLFGLVACSQPSDNSPDTASLAVAEPSSASQQMVQADAEEQAPPARNTGGLFGSADNPPSVWSASSTVARTTYRNEWVNLSLEDGVDLRSWVVYPEGDEPAPVVMVLQYEGGLDDWQRGIAYQLAYHGYIAVAPDLYSGFGPGGGGFDAFRTQSDAIRVGSAMLTSQEALDRALVAAEYASDLPRSNGSMAVIGFGSGGDLSFQFAAEAASVDAAVVFYGLAPEQEVVSRIQAPVIGFYGDDDPRAATADATAALMEQSGKSFEYHIYEDATRDFMLAQFEGVNTPASGDAWLRTVNFLQQYMQ